MPRATAGQRPFSTQRGLCPDTVEPASLLIALQIILRSCLGFA